MGSRVLVHRLRWRSITTPLVLAITLAASGARAAEPTAADRDTARTLMADGRAARDKGDLTGALRAFAAADDIMHVPTTGLELARAHVALGHLVEARETAIGVARIPERPNDPAPFKAARETARALADELDGRIPALTVRVSGVPEGASVTVSVDGTLLDGVGEAKKVNPGHHVVVAKAAAAEATREIDLGERESKDVALDLGASAPAAAAQGPDEHPPEQSSTGARVLLYGGMGLAGAGVVAGTIAGILSLSKTNSVKNSGLCTGDVCNPAEHDDLEAARTTATISTVSFVVAGGGAILAVVGLLLQSRPSEDSSARASRIEPWISLGAAGVRGRF